MVAAYSVDFQVEVHSLRPASDSESESESPIFYGCKFGIMMAVAAGPRSVSARGTAPAGAPATYHGARPPAGGATGKREARPAGAPLAHCT